MSFRTHGSVAIQEEGQILIARIAGPWNAELIAEYQQLMHAHVVALAARGPWGLIIEISGAALCPPDALERIRSGAREHARNWRRACTCYVIGPDVEGYRITDRIWRDIYAGVMPVEIVETHDAAVRWTAQQLATPPAPVLQE
ncbi:hypothetical protein GCM10027046_24650 [Uliginosibacterium flavum]|uniref:STAS/SEC14 domain-containing protein n=1 Tax=Uliginosibacterium flavum TaxID=1396831 RepID=A0ABV2TKE9_9RHOO